MVGADERRLSVAFLVNPASANGKTGKRWPSLRARAEALGLRGDVGLGSRAERVVVITAGLVLAPWGALQWAIYLLTATAWLTVLQRILFVRKQLIERR